MFRKAATTAKKLRHEAVLAASCRKTNFKRRRLKGNGAFFYLL